MTLEGIIDQVTCPLLVVHGANDRQVPLEQAERTVHRAINSPRAELRIFTAEEGERSTWAATCFRRRLTI